MNTSTKLAVAVTATLLVTAPAFPFEVSTTPGAGKTRATAAIIKLTLGGTLTIHNEGSSAVNVILDASGYFR